MKDILIASLIALVFGVLTFPGKAFGQSYSQSVDPYATAPAPYHVPPAVYRNYYQGPSYPAGRAPAPQYGRDPCAFKMPSPHPGMREETVFNLHQVGLVRVIDSTVRVYLARTPYDFRYSDPWNARVVGKMISDSINACHRTRR